MSIIIIIIGIVYERKNRILFVCRCVFNESNDIISCGANHMKTTTANKNLLVLIPDRV